MFFERVLNVGQALKRIFGYFASCYNLKCLNRDD